MYLKVYYSLLPRIASYSTLFGMFIGMTANERTDDSIHDFNRVIGYGGIGLMTGLVYPISFPLLGASVLYYRTPRI